MDYPPSKADQNYIFAAAADALNREDRENITCGRSGDLYAALKAAKADAYAEGYQAGRDGEMDRTVNDLDQLQTELQNAQHEARTARVELQDVYGMLEDALNDLDGARDALGLSGEALVEERSKNAKQWLDGMQFGSRIEQDRARTQLGSYVLEVLGKDCADGEINLGALGTFHSTRS